MKLLFIIAVVVAAFIIAIEVDRAAWAKPGGTREKAMSLLPSVKPSADDPQYVRLLARSHQLRVREISGGLFEALALDLIRGPTNIDLVVMASLKADEMMFQDPAVDVETRAAIKEGADDFRAKVAAARQP